MTRKHSIRARTARLLTGGRVPGEGVCVREGGCIRGVFSGVRLIQSWFGQYASEISPPVGLDNSSHSSLSTQSWYYRGRAICYP